MVAAPASEQEAVEDWRHDQLERAGYAPESADLLAMCLDVNLHEAVDLLVGGCDESTCLKILL